MDKRSQPARNRSSDSKDSNPGQPLDPKMFRSQAFYRISMSSRQPGTFLVNLALNSNNLALRNSNFKKAQIQAVEIISNDNQPVRSRSAKETRDDGRPIFFARKAESCYFGGLDYDNRITNQVRSIKDDPE